MCVNISSIERLVALWWLANIHVNIWSGLYQCGKTSPWKDNPNHRKTLLHPDPEALRTLANVHSLKRLAVTFSELPWDHRWFPHCTSFCSNLKVCHKESRKRKKKSHFEGHLSWDRERHKKKQIWQLNVSMSCFGNASLTSNLNSQGPTPQQVTPWGLGQTTGSKNPRICFRWTAYAT